jgi:hypothetical protein
MTPEERNATQALLQAAVNDTTAALDRLNDMLAGLEQPLPRVDVHAAYELYCQAWGFLGDVAGAYTPLPM